MQRSLVLAYWEIRRVMRSRKAMTALLAVPVACGAACVFPSVNKSVLHAFFPVAAILYSWIFLYVRACSDCTGGYGCGVESTPAAGTIAFMSRAITWAALSLVQMAVFIVIIQLAR